MSNEALDTIDRYFCNDENTMHFLGEKKAAQEVADYLSFGKILPSDSPDMVILHNGSYLAIEHFEFDSYKNHKSGSENRSEQARIERSFQAISSSNHGILVHDEIKGKSSYEQYVKNVSSIFQNHYNKIESYKMNLIEKSVIESSTPLKIAFLIEDMSPLGTIAYDDGGQHPVVLALSREFLKLMRNSPAVDYVITCSGAGSNNFIWIISRESLDEYDKNSVDYASMEFINFTPKVLSYTIEVSRENIKNEKI
ncbi:hypothetical protein [Aminipila sp.]|uniref:hypothetical protein n=1 Tax=Aminipila sp. TaxID=2060095 RepID=UPI0028A0DB3A|nr:hypothetical protein [Aminipila sp.]